MLRDGCSLLQPWHHLRNAILASSFGMLAAGIAFPVYVVSHLIRDIVEQSISEGKGRSFSLFSQSLFQLWLKVDETPSSNFPAFSLLRDARTTNHRRRLCAHLFSYREESVCSFRFQPGDNFGRPDINIVSRTIPD